MYNNDGVFLLNKNLVVYRVNRDRLKIFWTVRMLMFFSGRVSFKSEPSKTETDDRDRAEQ